MAKRALRSGPRGAAIGAPASRAGRLTRLLLLLLPLPPFVGDEVALALCCRRFELLCRVIWLKNPPPPVAFEGLPPLSPP